MVGGRFFLPSHGGRCHADPTGSSRGRDRDRHRTGRRRPSEHSLGWGAVTFGRRAGLVAPAAPSRAVMPIICRGHVGGTRKVNPMILAGGTSAKPAPKSNLIFSPLRTSWTKFFVSKKIFWKISTKLLAKTKELDANYGTTTWGCSNSNCSHGQLLPE